MPRDCLAYVEYSMSFHGQVTYSVDAGAGSASGYEESELVPSSQLPQHELIALRAAHRKAYQERNGKPFNLDTFRGRFDGKSWTV
jgi:hypothetical protein